jgi:hypothetical protein
MRRGDSRTYSVGELDLYFAEVPLWAVIGPVPNFDDAQLVETVNSIARGGPQNRVGLLPSRREKRWRFVSDPGTTLLRPPCPRDCTDIEQVLEHATTVRPDVPLAVWRCGDYLCLYFDHGLGDSRLVQRILVALTNGPEHFHVDTSATKTTRLPLAVALLTAIRRRPGQMLKDVGRIARSSGSRMLSTPAADHGGEVDEVVGRYALVPTPEEAGTVFVSSGSTFMDELREYRDKNHPTVSTNVMMLLAICTSLASQGVDLLPEVEILTDLRRFLPGQLTTLANFVAVVEVPFSSGATAEGFDAKLRSELASYQSVIKLIALLALFKIRYSWIRGGDLPYPEDLAHSSASEPTIVTISDFARAPVSSKIRWADVSRSQWATVTPPATLRHLQIHTTFSGDNRLQLTARFFRAHLEPDVVRAALTRAVDPRYFGLLGGS